MDRWHVVVLAAFVALVVARTLVPEDPGGQFGHGAPFSVLWLALVGAWLLGEFRQSRMRLRFDWIDALVIALFAWHTLGALIAFKTGQPRSAMNVMWDWISMACVYFLGRQILQTGRDIRAALVAMIGLAGGLAAVAMHQYFVTLPRDAAIYETARHSVQSLFEHTGQWMPEGSSIREQFETRLASRLPTATFALSNSLAGFLLVWLVMLVGVAFDFRGRMLKTLTFVAVVTLAYCIWLAGSRSAGVGAILGVACVIADRAFSGGLNSKRMRIGIVVTATAIVAIGGAMLLTPVGRGAFQAAWRSLAFRFEYWRATVAMIADAPIFGNGPGQFQDSYTAHKLVGAAEEIQDPHNWLLEVWATAGTPAAVLLIAIVVAAAIRALKISGRQAIIEAAESELEVAYTTALGGVLGVVLGVVIAWLTGYPLAQIHLLMLVAGIVGASFVGKQWTQAGRLPRRLPAIAIFALFVNLLAVGGIGYPSVADSFWLLLGIQINLSAPEIESNADPRDRRLIRKVCSIPLRWATAIALLTAIVLAIRYEYIPVLTARTHLALADAAVATEQGDLNRAALEAAVAADPWFAHAAVRLADQKYADYRILPTESQRRSLDEAAARARKLAPRRGKIWALSAEYAAAIFLDTHRVEYRNAVERFLQRALDLYPTSAALHSQAAEVWDSIGETDRARAEATEALRLDDALRDAGHNDRTLRPTERIQLESIGGSS